MSELPNDGKIRVVIADDHDLVRTGLRAVINLEQDMEVVGEAAGGEDALALAGELHPDVLLADLSMPPPDGIRLAARLKQEHPGIRVLILTMHEDPILAREAVKAGAAGYVVKRAAATDLFDAIRVAAKGGVYVHPDVR